MRRAVRSGTASQAVVTHLNGLNGDLRVESVLRPYSGTLDVDVRTSGNVIELVERVHTDASFASWGGRYAEVNSLWGVSVA